MLVVEIGLGGPESLYCQKIFKIYKPAAESAFPDIFTVNYENSDMSTVI